MLQALSAMTGFRSSRGDMWFPMRSRTEARNSGCIGSNADSNTETRKCAIRSRRNHEVQGQKENDFPHRIFTYNYRIHDLYNRPVVSLAVLADENTKWHPSSYHQELWGCGTHFHFPCVKILSYREKSELLETSDNPFAVVVRVQLQTMETKKDPQQRRICKAELIKQLYKRGFGKTDILNLYLFIDWIMVLPKELEESCFREIVIFEEEKKMPYISTAERIGIEKGLEKGLEKGNLIGRISLGQQLLKLFRYSKEELEKKSLKQLNAIWGRIEKKMLCER